MAPGLKPSLRSHSVASTCTPWALAGMADVWMFTRRPVTDERSRTV